MPTWVTHLMVADGIMKQLSKLDRRGFCVGNIAPDCNVENEDWTAYTPSREITHWMQGETKSASDGDAFYREYILKRREDIKTLEQYSFLLGYYAHLITDAAFEAFILDGDRVGAAWRRIKAIDDLCRRSAGMEQSWDSIRQLVPKEKIMCEIYEMEAEYLHDHPKSGYFTEILALKKFPDYIDYLPSGCIVRKIGVMGYIPEMNDKGMDFITISKEELLSFVGSTTELLADKFKQMELQKVFSEKIP